ncbi:MAG: SdrD B-like domain-containing protein [Caldilineaceae bacterium]
MSAQQESVGTARATEDAPELEYRAVSHDSLSMFLAAIGGAILGMLLTLLVLALINGGTLSFAGKRIDELENHLTRVDENVGAVSNNINIVSEQAASIQQQLGSVESSLRNEIESQNANIDNLSTAVETLNETRQRFQIFTQALSGALDEMAAVGTSAGPAIEGNTPITTTATSAPPPTVNAAEVITASVTPTDSTPVEGAPVTESLTTTVTAVLPAPQVVQSSDVPTDSITVLVFVDENRDGEMGDGETNLVGITVALQDSNGNTVATEQSGDAGAIFQGLEAGDYWVVVEDTLGYQLLSAASTTVTVASAATEGSIVYIPVAAE